VTASTIDAPNVKVLNRADLTKRLVAKPKCDEAVVGSIVNTNFDLYAAGHRLQNFYMLGSIGLACPIALAQPERGVIALEGDGSILMAPGCLATIGMVKPRADIVAIARGAGIADSHWVRDAAHFKTLMSRRFDEGGPVLLAAKIDDTSGPARPRPHPSALHARDRDRGGKARSTLELSLATFCAALMVLQQPCPPLFVWLCARLGSSLLEKMWANRLGSVRR
jgi:hypothetical protein